MNPKRFFYIMVAAFCLCIVGGGGMLYLANSVLKQRSSNVVDLKLQSAEVEAQLSAYQAAKADVTKYSYLDGVINSALPQDKDQARSLREIFLFAQQANITLKSVQFPSSTLGAVTSASGVSASSGGSAVTQATPVKGLSGVYSIAATVTPVADGQKNIVTYDELIQYLKLLESNRRAIQVASIQLTPLYNNGVSSITFTLTLNIFIKP